MQAMQILNEKTVEAELFNKLKQELDDNHSEAVDFAIKLEESL